jgi:hypothetical protein
VVSFSASGDSKNAILDGKLALSNWERCVKRLPSGDVFFSELQSTTSDFRLKFLKALA